MDRESVRLIQERNRRENMERYGCNCPAAKCYATCPKVLARAGGDELFTWWGRTSPPELRQKEVLPPGVPKKGSSKSDRKRKKKKRIDGRKYWLVD